MPVPGCIQHDYYIHAFHRSGRRNLKPIYICSYDFKDAFGSIDHSFIETSLISLGFEKQLRDIILEQYHNTGFWIQTKRGSSKIISQRRGVKQGDPLSPFIFNLCIEQLSRSLNEELSEDAYNHLLLADDLCTLTNDPITLRRLHNKIIEFCRLYKININSAKCNLLAIRPAGRKKYITDRHIELKILGEEIKKVDAQSSFTYLGNKVGYNRSGIRMYFKDLLEDTKRDLESVSKSGLKIYQKHHCIKTFVLPKLQYFIRLNGLGPHHAKLLGQALRKAVRHYCKLPAHSTLALYHCRIQDGGLGFPEPWEWSCSTQLLHCISLMESEDENIKSMVIKEIKDLLRTRYKDVTIDSNDIKLFADYANGKFESYKTSSTRDSFDPFAHLPKITKYLKVQIKTKQNEFRIVNEEDIDLQDLCNDNQNKFRRKGRLASLKAYCQQKFSQWWKGQLMQGKSAGSLSNRYSNAWLSNDKLKPKIYSFSLKARLDILPTNINRFRWNLQHRSSCLNCPESEDIHHILSYCPSYLHARTRRHDTILNRLARSIRLNNRDVDVRINQSPNEVESNGLRPDIIITDQTNKKVKIIDLVVTSQDKTDCLASARNRKIEKYQVIKDRFIEKGYEVDLNALALGDLGGTDQTNHEIISKSLNTPNRFSEILHKNIISDTLKFGYVMWGIRCSRH